MKRKRRRQIEGRNSMYGAVIGDVVGSRFEFDNIKTKKFTLVTKDSEFTDDTICTVAIMDWIPHSKNHSKEEVASHLRKWCRKYPNSGFGGLFHRWFISDTMGPYGILVTGQR